MNGRPLRTVVLLAAAAVAAAAGNGNEDDLFRFGFYVRPKETIK